MSHDSTQISLLEVENKTKKQSFPADFGLIEHLWSDDKFSKSISAPATRVFGGLLNIVALLVSLLQSNSSLNLKSVVQEARAQQEEEEEASKIKVFHTSGEEDTQTRCFLALALFRLAQVNRRF